MSHLTVEGLGGTSGASGTASCRLPALPQEGMPALTRTGAPVGSMMTAQRQPKTLPRVGACAACVHV